MATNPLLPGQRILAGEIPEIRWVHGDDLCSCTFQRIGEWTNPYIARTLRVRMCCIWAELYKEYPQFVQEIPAFYDYNADRFETEPMLWNGEDDMPAALWHRQLAVMRREPVEEVRRRFEGIEPPKGVPRPKPVQEETLQPMSIYEVAGRQAEKIADLEQKVNTLMDIVKKLKSGEIKLDDLSIGPEAPEPEKAPVAARNGKAK